MVYGLWLPGYIHTSSKYSLDILVGQFSHLPIPNTPVKYPESLYYQPKQCTIEWKIPQIFHTFAALFDAPPTSETSEAPRTTRTTAHDMAWLVVAQVYRSFFACFKGKAWECSSFKTQNFSTWDTSVDGWNPNLAPPLGWCCNPRNNGISTTYQLVQDFSHQQLHPGKLTNDTLEWVDISPVRTGGFPASHFGLPGK